MDLSTGKIIDDCVIDDTSDLELHRVLKVVDNIRVEITLKQASKLYERVGPDVAEIYSQPRVCQEVDGRKFGGDSLRPGWSSISRTKTPRPAKHGT